MSTTSGDAGKDPPSIEVINAELLVGGLSTATDDKAHIAGGKVLGPGAGGLAVCVFGRYRSMWCSCPS
ncbi:MAG: hypothetical protein M0014_12060 [Actinomycetota bacterium]|nr:hypothetical protein [Actinomycetota bacterium]